MFECNRLILSDYSTVDGEVPVNVGCVEKSSGSYSVKMDLTLLEAGWPNDKALGYESSDCRFVPCVGHFLLGYIWRGCWGGIRSMLGHSNLWKPRVTDLILRCIS